MKSITIISLLAAAGLAQAASSYIPTGISDSCTKFLTDLNTNSNFTSCTSAITTATSAFAPGSDLTSSSASTVSSALNNVCASSTSSACSETAIRVALSSFQTACNTELVSSHNAAVTTIYDVIYSIIPLLSAVCTKSDNGQYCVTNLAAVTPNATPPTLTSGTTLSTVQQYMGTTSPNATLFQAVNLPFLFLSQSLNANELCTTCTRNIITSWIDFEQNVPYASGLSNSALLSGQTGVFNAINGACGVNFLSGQVQAAGGLSGGLTGPSSGASKAVVAQFGAVAVAMGAVVVGVVASL